RHVRLGDGQAAVESTFATHLRTLRSDLETHLCRTQAGGTGLILHIAPPALPPETYTAQPSRWEAIDQEERIVFHSLFYDSEAGSMLARRRCWQKAKVILAELAEKSICIHSGLSWDPLVPFEFGSIQRGVRLKRTTV